MFSKTVIPLDNRDESASILAPASRLVKTTGGEIVLVTVLDPGKSDSNHAKVSAEEGPTPEHGEMLGPIVGASAPISSHPGHTSGDVSQGGSVGRKSPRAAELAGAVQWLEGYARQLRELGLNVSTRVVQGDPVDEVLRAIREEKADSLALATHHRSAIARTLVGSVTDELIQMSTVPVLSMHVRDNQKSVIGGTKFATVIVPLDGTPFGEMAVGPAIDLASRLDAKVMFLQSVDTPAVASTAVTVPEMLPAASMQNTESITAQTERYLASMVKKANAAGVEAVGNSHFGAASSVIISTVNAHEDAIVVMASHARSGIARTVLGSTADAVVRNLTSPVLIIKSDEYEGEA